MVLVSYIGEVISAFDDNKLIQGSRSGTKYTKDYVFK